MTTKPLIDDMDHFFAEQWQEMADEMERDGQSVIQPTIYAHALEMAAHYRDKIIAEAGRGR